MTFMSRRRMVWGGRSWATRDTLKSELAGAEGRGYFSGQEGQEKKTGEGRWGIPFPDRLPNQRGVH